MAAQQIGLAAVLDLADFSKGVDGYLDGLNQMSGQTDSFVGSIASGLGGIAGTLLDIGKVAATALVATGAAAGAGLTALFSTSVDAAATLEEGLSQVNAVLGLTGDLTDEQVRQQQELKDLAVGLSIDPGLKVNAEEAAQAFEILGRNGITAQQILDGAAHSTVLLANAVKTDFNTAGDIVSSTMLVFGKNAEDLGDIVNQITGVTVASKFTIEDYALALSQGGGVAAAVGVEFDDFNTIIAAISPSFASGSDAGTSFKTFLQRLIPQSAEAANAMRDLGLFTGQTDKEFQKTQADIAKVDAQIAKLDPTAKNYTKRVNELTAKKQELTAALNDGQNAFFNADGSMKSAAEITQILHDATQGLSEEQKLQAFTTIFGTDAFRAAAAMAGITADEFNELKGQIMGVSATEMAAEQMSNLNAALATLGDTFTGLQIKLGDQFLKPLAEAVRAVTTLLGDNVDNIVAFFQPLIDFLIKQISRIPEIMGVIGPMIGRTFEPIRQLFFIEIPDALDFFIGAFLDGFKQGTDLADGFFKGLENILSQPLGIQPDFIEIPIRMISQAILFLRRAIPQIITFFGPLITFVTETLPRAMATVASAFFGGFQQGDTLIHSILAGVGGLLETLFPAETVQPFISALTRLVDFLGGEAARGVGNLGEAIRTGLGAALDFIGHDVLPFLTKAINTFLATGEIPIFSDLADSLKDFDLAGLIEGIFGDIDWANLIPGLDLSTLFTDLGEIDLSGLAETFNELSASVINFLDNVIAPILEKLPFFSDVFGDAEGEISGFGAVLATLGAGAGGFALVDILISAAGAAFTLLSPLAALATTGAGIATILGTLGVSLSGILLPLAAVAAVAGLLAVAWINDWGGIREIVANVFSFIMTIAGGVVDFFVSQWPAISEAVSFLGWVFGALGEAISAVVTDVFIPLQTDTFAQLTGALNDMGLTWGDVFSALMTATVTVLGVVIGLIAGVIGIVISLAAAIASAVNTAVTWWRAFLNAAMLTFTGAMEIITGFGYALGALLSGDIGGFIAGIKVGFQGILDFFTGIWSTLAIVVSAPFAIVISLVSGFVTTIIEFFSTLYNTLVGNSIIPDLITAIVTYFTSLGPQLIAAVATTIAAVVTAFANGVNLIIAAVTPLLAGVVAVFSGLITSIQGVFTAALGFWIELGAGIISGLIEGFASLVDSFLTNVTTFVSDVLTSLEELTGFDLPDWLTDMPAALDAIRGAISKTLGFISDLVSKVKDLATVELPPWLQLGSPPELAIALSDVADAGGAMPNLAKPFIELSRTSPDVESLHALSEALGVVGLSADEAAASVASFHDVQREPLPNDPFGMPAAPTESPITPQTTGQMDTFLAQLREMGNIDVDAWGVITKQDPAALMDFMKKALAGEPLDKLLQSWASEAQPDMRKLGDMLQQPFLKGMSPDQIQQTARAAFGAISDGARQAEPELKQQVGAVIESVTPPGVDVPLSIPVDQATVDTAIVGMQDLMANGMSAAEAFDRLPAGLQAALQIAAANGPALNEALVTPFGAAKEEVTSLFTDLRSMMAAPVTPTIQPIDTASLESSRQAFSNYVNAVMVDGDFLNDWLTHLPAGIHDSAQGLGQSIAEIQTQFQGLGGDELIQAQAAFDNYINAVLTSGDTLNEFLGQLPAATQASAQEIGEVVAQLNSELQTTAPTAAITPTVDPTAVAQTQTTLQGLGASVGQSLGQGTQAAQAFQTSLSGALGPEAMLGVQTGVSNVVGSMDAMNMSSVTSQTSLATLGGQVAATQITTDAFTAALTTMPPALDAIDIALTSVGERANELGEITGDMNDRIAEGFRTSAEATGELIAAFDALIAKAQEVQGSLPPGVMPGSPPPLAMGLMAVAAAARSLPDLAAKLNEIDPNIGAVSEFANALAQVGPPSFNFNGGSLAPVEIPATAMLDNLAQLNSAKVEAATSLNTVGAAQVRPNQIIHINLQQTNQFDGRQPDETLVNSLRDETRTLILDVFDGRA